VRGTAGIVPHVKCDRSGFYGHQDGTGMIMPTGIPTGCYDYAHDNDVGVVVRLELGVIITGFGLNVKRAEVAACENCGGKSSGGREARLSDSRVGSLSRCRRVSSCKRCGSDAHHSHDGKACDV